MGEAGSRKLAAGRREQLQQMADANTATTGGTQPVAAEDAEADREEGGGAADVSVRPSTSYGELLSPRDRLGANSAWYFGHTT